MYELRVLTGLHRGAAFPLIGPQWLIGSDDQADLMLLDPAIKPSHCSLTSIEDGWSLVGEQGKLTDCEGHQCDEINPLYPDTTFALNGIWMTIVDATTPWLEAETPSLNGQQRHKASEKKRTVIPWVIGFTGAVAVAASSTWAALTPTSEQLQEPESGSVSASVRSQSPVSTQPQLVLDNMSDEITHLQDMLKERELDHTISVKHTDQFIQLTGAVSSDQQSKVTRMLTRFEHRYQVKFPVHDDVQPIASQLPFEIVQITSGPMGNVVTSDGQRLFVGDEIDGIRLVSIQENKIIFNGKRHYEIHW